MKGNSNQNCNQGDSSFYERKLSIRSKKASESMDNRRIDKMKDSRTPGNIEKALSSVAQTRLNGVIDSNFREVAV